MRVVSILAALAALSSSAIPPAASAQAPTGEPPEHVRMSLEHYQRLMDAARRQGGPTVAWGRGDAAVTLPDGDGQFITVTLTASGRAHGEGLVEVVLLPADVVIESVTAGGMEATLIRRAGAHVAVLPEGTQTFSLSVRYLVPVSVSGAGRMGLIPLPPLTGSTVRVTGASDAEVWPGGRVERTPDGALVATLPSTAAMAVRFGGALGGHQVRRVAYTLDVDAQAEGVGITSRWEVQLSAPEAPVRLAPATLPLVEVTEKDRPVVTRVRDGWHEAVIEGVGAHVLVARFRMAVDRTQGQPRVVLPLDEVPITQIQATIPGDRAVELEPAVPLLREIQGEGDAQVTVARGYLPPSREVVVKWTETRPSPEAQVRVNTETYQLVEIQEGVLRSRIHVRYQILRGKTKELAIQIPEGVVLYKVGGETIEDWRTFAATEEEPRHVRVFLGREREGTYELTLELETVVRKAEGTQLPIPVVRPMNAFRETGVVALFDGKKVGFTQTTQTGFTKVGQDALPSDIQAALEQTVNEAFKHIGEPGTITSTVTEVEAKEVLYDARVVTLYNVKEGAILANATVQVEIKSGRDDDLVLSFPEDVTILAVIAPSISRKGELAGFDGGPGRKGYELKFSQALEGIIEVHLEFELVLKDRSGPVRLPDVRVEGAEVEEGSFGITAETGIEVSPQPATELRRVDVAELPESVRRRAASGREILLGYQYAHTPWSLELDIKRHRTVETLTAAVSAAWLETTLYEDGHVVTRAVYDVKNEDRQFLRMSLPEGSTVWTVASDGEPIKAVKDESGAVAIPLRKRQSARIEVVFEVRQEGAMGRFGGLTLTAPELDALVTDLQWRVRAPREYTLYNVDTSMEEVEPWQYREPGQIGSREVPVALPPAEDMAERLFRLPVKDPSEDPTTLSFSFAARPGDGLGGLVWWLAVLLLVVVVYRLAGGRRRGGLVLGLLVVAAVLIAAKLVLWTLEPAEGWIGVGVLAAAAVIGWLTGGGKKTPEEG